MAMDVDATTTRATKEDFQRRMGSVCYGCGRTGHRIKSDNCRARNTTCRYCKRVGHFEQCCEDKFCGRERDRGLHSNNNRQGRGRGGGGGGQRVNAAFTLFPGEALQDADPAPAVINAAAIAPAPAPAVAAPDVVTRAELDTIRQAINALTTVVMSNQRQGGQDDEDFQ